jgi:hypothetical protein
MPHLLRSTGVDIVATHDEETRWAHLEARAHLPEAQDEIRAEIFKETIRVVPDRDGGVRIIPLDEGDDLSVLPARRARAEETPRLGSVEAARLLPRRGVVRPRRLGAAARSAAN